MSNYRLIYETFYNCGLDLITSQEEYDKCKDTSLDSVEFCYTGPCKHIRRSTLKEIFKICPHCEFLSYNRKFNRMNYIRLTKNMT
jgi:hypothetical protein